MGEHLVFQLYAPLAAWGGQAVGQERPSDDHPGRSALLGLIAAALGIRRDDEDAQQALRDACRFAIKLLAPGLVLRDFHTIQVPPSARKQQHLQTRRDELREAKLGTMLSFRSYRQDALCLVAVISDDGKYGVERLERALLAPEFPLYLGRKSCPPAAPLNPEIIPAKNLKTALDSYCVAAGLAPLFSSRPRNFRPRYYWEQGMDAGIAHDYRAPRYDQPVSRRRWQFAPRDEYAWLGGES
ncbi:MAG TPA: type I-E CRISPR-associated protein Cas5/CasD [Gammaproteobacteria bacterium]|nr:type I-E CRISPR-associated protein Cas5/CasD [Gammaproteobacteria bacterium]